MEGLCDKRLVVSVGRYVGDNWNDKKTACCADIVFFSNFSTTETNLCSDPSMD